MTLRLSDEDTARLRQRAAADGVSMQRPALSAIQAYLDARERDELVGAGVEYALDRYPDALRRLGE
jgi:predicted transcriptional regulator